MAHLIKLSVFKKVLLKKLNLNLAIFVKKLHC